MGTDRNSSDEVWIGILSQGNRRNSTKPIGSDVPSLTRVPNPKAPTYTDLFERFKEEALARNKQFNLKRIVSDFEPGLISVIKHEVSVYSFVVHPNKVKKSFLFASVSNDNSLWLSLPF